MSSELTVVYVAPAVDLKTSFHTNTLKRAENPVSLRLILLDKHYLSPSSLTFWFSLSPHISDAVNLLFKNGSRRVESNQETR